MEMLTVEAFRATQKQPASTSSADKAKLWWVGEHATTHHRITVTLRADRRPIISMLEQGCQVCQVHVDNFLGNFEEQKAVAFDFMKEIAMAYCSNKIKKDELFTARGDKLISMGLDRPMKGKKRGSLMKKPSGAAEGADGEGEASPSATKVRRLRLKAKPAASEGHVMRRPAAAWDDDHAGDAGGSHTGCSTGQGPAEESYLWGRGFVKTVGG